MSSALRFLLVCVSLAVAACGGDGGNRTLSSGSPTSPSPSPSIPACDAIGATADGTTAIINGSECSSSRSPVVLLNARDASGSAVGSCSGTIIAPRAVLTAAHCLDGDTALVRVWLGSGAEITAQSFRIHPTYAANRNGLDIGIVLMGEDLPRTPMPVLTGREAQVGETAVVVGWGRDQSNIPSTLRAGSTTISGIGSIFLETLFSVNAASICSGDSGGPLLLLDGSRWAIAAVSAAASVATCNSGTNFYVRVRNPDVSSFIFDVVPGATRR